jgi:RND family efflux transporter MFP subunit
MRSLMACLLLLTCTPALARAPDIRGQTFDCVMMAASRVKLGAQIAGVLRRVNVDRGDVVKAGQLLAELASDVEQAQLQLARVRAENDTALRSNEAKLELARNRLARMTRLRMTNATTEKEFDEAQAGFRVAEMELRDATFNQRIAAAELKRVEEQVAQRQIISPSDGVIVERHLSPGEYVTDQSQVFSLARIDVLHVEVYVPVAYFGQVLVGGRATIMPEAPVGGRHAADVMVVDNVIDASSATFGVRLRLPNENFKLPAGLRCRVGFDQAPPG